MIQIQTKDAEKFLRKLIKQLSPKEVAIATRMALNDSIRKGRTEIKRTILSMYNIKSSRVDDRDNKKGLSLKLATTNKLSAEVDAGHIPVNLVNIAGTKMTKVEVGRSVSFASSIKTKKTKARRGGKVYRNQLSVEVVKGDRKVIATAFMISKFKNAGGGTTNISTGAIFARGKRGKPSFEFGKSRMPIDSISAVSVATAAMNTNAQQKVQPVVSTYYAQQLERQLNRMLEKNLNNSQP